MSDKKLTEGLNPAKLELAAAGEIVFTFEFDDKIYENKRDFKLFNFLEELYNLPGGKDIFEKYEAVIDLSE